MVHPYTDTEAWVEFTHDDGTRIRRPMFSDGGRIFRVRFASTKPKDTWRWTTAGRESDLGLNGHSGTLTTGPAVSEHSTIFTRHGFWSISSGSRNLVHADGRSRKSAADDCRTERPLRSTAEPPPNRAWWSSPLKRTE